MVKALRDSIKRETTHAVLAMELTRLDAMQAAVYAEAINGDTGAPAPASSAFVQCFPKDLLGFLACATLCNY